MWLPVCFPAYQALSEKSLLGQMLSFCSRHLSKREAQQLWQFYRVTHRESVFNHLICHKQENIHGVRPRTNTMYILLFIIFVTLGSKAKTPYPYLLGEEHHAVAGSVLYDAHKGTRVKAILEKHQSEHEEGSHGTSEEEPLLRVVRRLVSGHKQVNTTVRFDITGMTKLPEPSRLTSGK